MNAIILEKFLTVVLAHDLNPDMSAKRTHIKLTLYCKDLGLASP